MVHFWPSALDESDSNYSDDDDDDECDEDDDSDGNGDCEATKLILMNIIKVTAIITMIPMNYDVHIFIRWWLFWWWRLSW